MTVSFQQPPPPQSQPQPQPEQPPQPQPQQPPQPQRTIKKFIVEVVDARDLLPKDGQGSSSAYVVADFDGQRKRTATKYKDLNPVWNEPLEFVVSDPNNMDYEELEIEVLNDKRYGNSGTDIPSTVDRIMFPEVPIALRMSGHLLLGVVRIYSKKVEYLHHDCNVVLNGLKKAFVSIDLTLPENGYHKQFKRGIGWDKLHLSSTALTSRVSFQRTESWSIGLSENVYRPIHTTSHRYHALVAGGAMKMQLHID
ncbi:hypothetical protein ACLB2K_058811 [Fragaria x ananassa]